MRPIIVSTLALVAILAAEPKLQAASVVSQTAAARHGLKRAWFAQIGAPQSTGPISHATLDRGTLLVQTERNLLTALDPETGRILWSSQVGPPHHLSTEPAANHDYVTVVNGSILYVLDRFKGGILWQRQIGGSPGAGPGITDTHVFVPLVTGLVEGFDLAVGPKQSPWIYKSAGRVLTSPVGTARSVCWTTEKGYLYAADPNGKGILYRLETRDTIHSRPASWSPRLFACSTDGFVYAVNEAKGKIEWRFTVGDAIYASPVAIEDKVFIISEREGMFCLDAKIGTQAWFAPRVVQFLAVSPTRVYAADRVGRLLVLDAQTGARLGAMPLDPGDLKVVNMETDRLYLANQSGVVQCLHESALASPVTYTPPPPEEPEDKKAPKMGGEKKEKPAAVRDADEAPEEPADDAAGAMDQDKPEAPAEGDADDPFK